MSFFTHLAKAPIESIFAIAEAAKRAGKDAINASIGIILDEEGKPFVLECVRKAAQEWTGADDVSYPPLLGVPEFRKGVSRLAFGDDANIASIAAAGGTGALTINLKLLSQRLGITHVILPVPSWPNHKRILDALGIHVIEVPYLQDHQPMTKPLMDAINQNADTKIALLLHASSHNPTGKSFDDGQWKELAKALSGRNIPVLLDCAYQGLGMGVGEDVESVRILRAADVPVLLAWSASKNHTVYGLRAGLACTAVNSAEERKKIEGHYQILTRELYSAAPVTGQRIVGTVQQKYRSEWESELGKLRNMLQKKRQMLMDAFPNWKHAIAGEGLFTILPLSPEQVDQLATKHLFLTRDGRINIAGISLKKMEQVVELIKNVGANR